MIQSRFEYANWFLNTDMVGHCVFIDECGYNIWTARSDGRAAVGERGPTDRYAGNEVGM